MSHPPGGWSRRSRSQRGPAWSRPVGSLRYKGTSPVHEGPAPLTTTSPRPRLLTPLPPLGLGCHHRNWEAGGGGTHRHSVESRQQELWNQAASVTILALRFLAGWPWASLRQLTSPRLGLAGGETGIVIVPSANRTARVKVLPVGRETQAAVSDRSLASAAVTASPVLSG